jgi:hypothetical protein
MLDMLTDIRLVRLEQFNHLNLREPDGIVAKMHII